MRAAAGKFYNLSAIIGRYGRDLDQLELTGEGKPAVIAPATSWDQFTTVTITGVGDSNNDVFISLRLSDVGGQTTGWAIVGLDVIEVASAGALSQSITVREVTARQLSVPAMLSVPAVAPPKVGTPRASKLGAPLALTTATATSQPASTTDIDDVFARLEGLALWQ